MLEINLLPWRASLKEKNTKNKKLFFLSICIFILLFYFFHIALGVILNNKSEEIANLNNQLVELTSQNHKNIINSSILMTNQIHFNQLELINFFEQLEKNTSIGISWLTLTSKKNHIIAMGNTDSISVLTQFVNSYNFNKTSLLMNIIGIIKNKNDITTLQFKVHVMRSDSPALTQKETNDVP